MDDWLGVFVILVVCCLFVLCLDIVGLCTWWFLGCCYFCCYYLGVVCGVWVSGGFVEIILLQLFRLNRSFDGWCVVV